MSEKGLTILEKERLLPGLEEVHLERCVDFLARKQRRLTFKIGQTIKTQKLKLIHSNICSPMPIQFPSGRRYFITFIDDATRKLLTYPLRSKDEALDAFKKFLTQAE